jgi:enoyl-CoA hydratase
MLHLKTSTQNNITIITISRPEALNALNATVIDELSKIIEESYTCINIKGIIITGDGEKAFVAGADIKELSVLSEKKALELALKGQRLFKRIEDCPKPVIAAVNGFALGGGCELAMACHMRIATTNAKFGQPEVNLGIIPGYGGTQRLAQHVGRGKALELILTGDLIGAEEAKSLGLVNHVVENQNQLIELSLNILNKISTKAPIAIARAIESINAGYSFEAVGYETEAKSFASCSTTQDFKEGTAAFLEKRKANFTGK